MSGSWAVSFGMPSAQPDDWRRDIEKTRGDLREDQLLVVSVVGTIQPDWSIDELADDYALCARWAVESGADAIETNFSCPNVCSRDGQLYQEPKPAGIVASRVRAAIGTTPYLAKIGHLDNPTDAILLLDVVSEFVDGLAMTNSVATSVREPKGRLMFAGQKRGICGAATRKASIAQTKMFSELIKTKDLGIKLIGVGGVGTSEHVRAYLEAGAEAVHIATAAMVDPLVACSIRKSF